MNTEEVKQAFKDICDTVGTVNMSSHNQMREGLEGAQEIAETAIGKLNNISPKLPLSSLADNKQDCEEIAKMLRLEFKHCHIDNDAMVIYMVDEYDEWRMLSIYFKGAIMWSEDSEIPHCLQICAYISSRYEIQQ